MNVVTYNDQPNFVVEELRQRNQDYIGLMVQDHIQELQIQYARTALGNSSTTGSNLPQRQQLLLNVFGEVERAVVVGAGGSYNVVYAQ